MTTKGFLNGKHYGGVVGVDTERETSGRWSTRLVSITAVILILLVAAVIALAALVGEIAGPVSGMIAGVTLSALAWVGVRPWLP